MSTKGFTLIELLLVLMISSLILLLSPSTHFKQPYVDIELFESNVIHTQFMSLLNHKENQMATDVITSYPIKFSEIGNIYFPQTIYFENTSLVMSLGPGRIYEKSKYSD